MWHRAAGPPTKPVPPHRRTNPLPLVANFVKKFTRFKVSNTVFISRANIYQMCQRYRDMKTVLVKIGIKSPLPNTVFFPVRIGGMVRFLAGRIPCHKRQKKNQHALLSAHREIATLFSKGRQHGVTVVTVQKTRGHAAMWLGWAYKNITACVTAPNRDRLKLSPA